MVLIKIPELIEKAMGPTAIVKQDQAGKFTTLQLASKTPLGNEPLTIRHGILLKAHTYLKRTMLKNRN